MTKGLVGTLRSSVSGEREVGAGRLGCEIRRFIMVKMVARDVREEERGAAIYYSLFLFFK